MLHQVAGVAAGNRTDQQVERGVVKHWHNALASGLLVSALVGCSGASDPDPATSAPTAAPGTGAATPSEAAPTENPFTVKLDAAVAGGDTGNEDLTVPLQPGQTYRAQAFDLEEIVEFSADAEDATPTAAVTPSVYQLSASPLLDYYETELAVDGVVGKGQDAVLVSNITMVGRNPQTPDRIASAGDDTVVIVGLDANGDVIAKGTTVIEPIADGETAKVETLAGGGDSSDMVRNQVPAATYDDVVTWEIGMLQPVYTEIHKIGL